MKHIPEDLYKKFVIISDRVRTSLRQRGMIVPIEHDNNTISIGYYTIKKDKSSFYSICDYAGEPVVELINLPQSAILIANNLALGKFLDQGLLSKDRNYGYALFKEDLYKKAVLTNTSRNPSRAALMRTQQLISQSKKESLRKVIIAEFEKLRKIT